MEVKEFRDSREAELSAFQKKYESLKQEYSSALSIAIQEKDASKQEALITQVKQINKQLINEIRDILAILNKGKTLFSRGNTLHPSPRHVMIILAKYDYPCRHPSE
jgi:hypothetical protein